MGVGMARRLYRFPSAAGNFGGEASSLARLAMIHRAAPEYE